MRRASTSAIAIVHQKTITVDDAESLISTFNLVDRYAATSRNFGYFDTNPADVQAIVATFDQWSRVAVSSWSCKARKQTQRLGQTSTT